MDILKSAAPLALSVFLLVTPQHLAAQEPDDKVIMTIDAIDIRQSDFVLFEQLDPSFQNLQGAQKQLAILSAIIDVKSLAKQAASESFDQTEAFKQRMALLQERSLHNSYFQEKIVKIITEDDIKERYIKEVAATEPELEVRARHILVETEAEAKAIIAELQGGSDFEALAKEKSTGPSGPQGGDLGYFGKGQMVPSFEAAAFELEAGAITDQPVQTQFGFHIIKVEDKRERPFPPFEQVEAQIRQVLFREKYVELVEGARQKVDIQILDEALKAQYEAARN